MSARDDLTEQLALLEARLAETVERRREAEVLAMDTAALVGRVRSDEREIEASIRSVKRTLRLPVERPSRAGKVDPHVQAGRYSEVALGVFRDSGGPLSQREVGERGGIGTGTLTHAIRALALDGLIESTGERVNRSAVFRLTSKGRRVTRRPPGSKP